MTTNGAESRCLFGMRRVTIMATIAKSDGAVCLTEVRHRSCVDQRLAILSGLGCQVLTCLHVV